MDHKGRHRDNPFDGPPDLGNAAFPETEKEGSAFMRLFRFFLMSLFARPARGTPFSLMRRAGVFGVTTASTRC